MGGLRADVLRKLAVALAALLLQAQGGAWAAEQIVGRVVAIADGDTLTVLIAAQQHVRVRLAEIDTPEAGQPYGSRAREALSELAFGKEV